MSSASGADRTWVLRLAHPVPDFDRWKASFDSDVLNRGQSGVLSYRILRLVGNPDEVLIDLDCRSLRQAEDFLRRLREVWDRVEPTGLIGTPQAEIAEEIESGQYTQR